MRPSLVRHDRTSDRLPPCTLANLARAAKCLESLANHYPGAIYSVPYVSLGDRQAALELEPPLPAADESSRSMSQRPEHNAPTENDLFMRLFITNSGGL